MFWGELMNKAQARFRVPSQLAGRNAVRSALMTALVMVLGLAGLMASTPARAAVPAFGTTATVVDLSTDTTETTSGTEVTISGAWELEIEAGSTVAAPAGFAIDLPAALQGQTDSFPMVDGSTQVGQCTVEATVMYCLLDEEYASSTSTTKTLSGNFSFSVRTVNTTDQEIVGEITVDGLSVEVVITDPTDPTDPGDPDPDPCATNPDSCTEYPGLSARKTGSYNRETGLMTWVVYVPAPAEGMPADQDVVVEDVLGANQEWATYGGVTAKIQRTNKYLYYSGETGSTIVRDIDWNAGSVIADATAPTDTEVFDFDGSSVTVSFTTEEGDSAEGRSEGWFYRVILYSRPTDYGFQKRYTNEATVTVDGTSIQEVDGTATYTSGSATGVSAEAAKFRIKKVLDGTETAVDAVEGTVFSGTWTVIPAVGESTSGDWSVSASDADDPVYWESAEFPKDGTVTITETAPTALPGISWGSPTISPETFVLTGGSITTVTVSNPVEVTAGSFSVTKVLEAANDDQRVVDAVGTTGFTVDYTVNGIAQTPLTVAAGETAESPAIEQGASVVLTEVKPEVPGIVWGTEVFSPASFTIGAGQKVEVTLTNPASLAAVSVGDYTWLDFDKDGIQDSDESGLAGVEVQVVDSAGNPVTDVDGNEVGNVITDGNGHYLFDRLPASQTGYTVKVVGVPDGYYPTPLIETGTDSSLDSSLDEATSVALPADGDSDLTLDFGFVTYAPEIDVIKTDVDGNDANTAGEAVKVSSGGSLDLVFTITNTGDEPLVDVSVEDAVTAGSGTVSDLNCVFPDGSEGVFWTGPFTAEDSFECTATLSGIEEGGDHTDVVTVSATGSVTGTPVSDEDPFNAYTPEASEDLAYTGAELGGLVGVAALAVVLGAGIIGWSRRVRRG